MFSPNKQRSFEPFTSSANPSTNKGSFGPIQIFRQRTETSSDENMCTGTVNSDIRFPNPLEGGVRFVSFRKPLRSVEKLCKNDLCQKYFQESQPVISNQTLGSTFTPENDSFMSIFNLSLITDRHCRTL